MGETKKKKEKKQDCRGMKGGVKMYSDPERSPDSNGIDINKRNHRNRKERRQLAPSNQVTLLFFEVGSGRNKWPARTEEVEGEKRNTKDG